MLAIRMFLVHMVLFQRFAMQQNFTAIMKKKNLWQLDTSRISKLSKGLKNVMCSFK